MTQDIEWNEILGIIDEYGNIYGNYNIYWQDLSFHILHTTCKFLFEKYIINNFIHPR